MEEKEKKKMSPKISRRIIIIGAIVIAIGLLLIGLGPGVGIELCVGGGFVIIIGIAVTLTGLTPYMIKLGAKIQKETLDYAGDDISAVGVRGVEVAEPIINKGVDVVEPNVEKVVRSAKNGVSGTTNKKGSHCTECGAKMEQNEAFCSNCGTKHANVCECGHTNDVNDKFCGKCGKPLK